jgi:hypothetical protein
MSLDLLPPFPLRMPSAFEGANLGNRGRLEERPIRHIPAS